MSPTAHWHPADYYLARDRARAAFDRANSQLQIGGLDEGVARAGDIGCGPLVEPARILPLPGAGSLSPGLNAEVAQKGPVRGQRHIESGGRPCEDFVPGGGGSEPSSALSHRLTSNATAPVAGLPQGLRDRSQEGA